MGGLKIEKNSKIYTLIKIALILFGIQLSRMATRKIFLSFAGESVLKSDMATLLFMLIFTMLFLLFCRSRSIELSVFPKVQNKGTMKKYVAATLLVLFFIITSPVLYDNLSVDAVMQLFSSTLAVPVFEELIFRGYVWNRLKLCFEKEIAVYAVCTILFALWHLGYADIISYKMFMSGGSAPLYLVMAMKAVTGLCYGIAAGFVRFKAKNCYASTLMHSFMNIFGR
jgi:membrane protease YdiL (CAAX protease family)